MSDETSSTQAPVETQQTSPEDTSTSNGQAVGSAPDSWKIDPNNLDPKLKPIYISMQGDYTKSKMALSEERRAFESERAQFLKEMQESMQTPKPQVANEELDEPEKLRQLIHEETRRAAFEMTKPQRLEKADQDIKAVRENYGELFDRYLAPVTEKIRASRNSQGLPSLTIQEAFRAVVPDAEFEQHVRAKVMKELSTKSNSVPSMKPGPGGSTTPVTDKLNYRQAFEAAKRELGHS